MWAWVSAVDTKLRKSVIWNIISICTNTQPLDDAALQCVLLRMTRLSTSSCRYWRK
jgi:hypothetical protein